MILIIVLILPIIFYLDEKDIKTKLYKKIDNPDESDDPPITSLITATGYIYIYIRMR